MRLFQRNRHKDGKSAHIDKRGKGRIRRFVRRESEHLLWLLPYLFTLFGTLFYSHPGLHYLVAAGAVIVVALLLWSLIAHLFQILIQDPFAPPVPFPWRRMCEDLFILLLPVLALALLMLLSHYPW